MKAWREPLGSMGPRFARDSGANLYAIAALAIGSLTVTAGGAVDYAAVVSARSTMQNAVDSAALAGVKEAAASRDAIADRFVQSGIANVTFASGPTITKATDASTGNYSVTASGSVPTSFLSILGFASLPISATATAGLGGTKASPACLIALDPSATPDVTGIIGAGAGGLNASGSGTMALTGCNIYVNSTSAKSIDVTGGGTVSADYVFTAGGYSGLVKATQASNGLPTTGSKPVADPYAGRTVPSWFMCAPPMPWVGFVANSTGLNVYCGTVNVAGPTTLAPGVYIIADGSLVSSSPITGNGVTIILSSKTPATNKGVFDFKAGATLTLTAPTSGPTAGIALWADARLPHGADNFRAGTTGNINGAIYLPSHMVNYSGSAKTTSTCTQLVADQIAVSGGASFQHQCTGMPISDPGSAGTNAYLIK